MLRVAAAGCSRRLLATATAAAAQVVELPVVDVHALDWRRSGVAAAAERHAALCALRAACEAPVGAFSARTEAFIDPALLERCYAHTRAFHSLPDDAKAPYHHTRDRNGRCAHSRACVYARCAH